MSRLFITPREINFINDLGKEIIKDVIGQKIYLFPISEVKTKIHDVYEEAVDKIFDNPIEVDCAVNWQPEEITSTRFGSEEYWTIEIQLYQYLQYRMPAYESLQVYFYHLFQIVLHFLLVDYWVSTQVILNFFLRRMY